MILEKISFLIRKRNTPEEQQLLESLLRDARASMEEDGVMTSLVWINEISGVSGNLICDSPEPSCDLPSDSPFANQEISIPFRMTSDLVSTLWLTDCAEGVQILKKAAFSETLQNIAGKSGDGDGTQRNVEQHPHAFAGWRHALNSEENLSGTSYILEDLPQIDMDDFEKVYEREMGLPWTILETDRLVVREFTDSDEDLSALYRIYDDSEARRFLAPLLADPEDERRTLRDYIRNVYEFYGFGSWAILLKETGEIIGRAGFGLPDSAANAGRLDQCSPGQFIPSFGYIIDAVHRGQGFASEVTGPLLRFGFDTLGFDAVYAEADRDNVPSVKLLIALGFEKIQGDAESPILPFLLRA